MVGKVPLSKKVQCLSMNYMRNNIVVCDGSSTDSDGIKNSFAANNIHYLWICDGDLWVADTDNASIGLCRTVHKSLCTLIYQERWHSALWTMVVAYAWLWGQVLSLIPNHYQGAQRTEFSQRMAISIAALVRSQGGQKEVSSLVSTG